MSKCLVTGGAGFIGSNIVDELLKNNHEVRVLDNLSTGSKKNLASHAKEIDLVKGDLRDLSAVKKAVKGMTYVFHVGALRAVARSVDNPMETNEVNVCGTLNVLTAARKAGVKRVIYSASSSAYGNAQHFPLRETDKPDPQSPYAATKLMGENYCRIFTHLYGLETVSLRYFNVFGPRQNPESKYSAVIPIFIDHILRGRSPEINWDGGQSRDFSYIDNVVKGNLCAMKAGKEAIGEVFNIACHEEFSILDIFNELKKILNKPEIKPIFTPKRAGDVRRTFADISKAQKILKFKVQTRFKPGLAKTVDWFLSERVIDRAKL